MMKTFASLMATTIIAVTALTIPEEANAVSTDGIGIDYLGVNNTLVRVKGNERYLLLPVQESNDEATVNVLIDGKVEKTIYVRLAKSKVDYHVPLDIKEWTGHDIVLNIVTSQNRSNVREAKEDACWKNFVLTDWFNTVNREKYRPVYHHAPLYGWMNDPNGMFWKDGVWHLYYQWNPYGSKWQNMTWGHSTSRDLINWEHHEAAIEPNGLGTVFSGSSVVDNDNTAGFGDGTVVSLYTSAGVSQVQSLAWSDDNGETFTIYPANPVLTLDSEARDPNMFMYKPTGEWIMVLAHPLDHEMLIFSSPDLKEWTLQSVFGKGQGCQDGVWECPDLMELPIEGTDRRKWVLLCNINPGGPFGGSATQYFTGDFDGKTFTPDKDSMGNVVTKWMDYGKDNYATVSWSNALQGRNTIIGWMSNWQYGGEVPTMQFRSANTLPREAALFTGDDGQLYMSSAPSPEVEMLRDKLVKNFAKINARKKAAVLSLPTVNDGICEILLDADCRKCSELELTLSNDNGEKVVMTYDRDQRTMSVDRRKSGITDFSEDFPCVTTAPTRENEGKISLRIFIDRSSIELFGNDGHFVMTNLVFPTVPYTTLSISAIGGNASVSNIKIYSLSIK